MDDKIKGILEECFPIGSMSLLVCTRVWEAWGVNTMTQDDFHEIGEDTEFLNDLAIQIEEGLLTKGTTGIFYDDPEDKNYIFSSLHDIRKEEYRYQSEDLGYWKYFEPLSMFAYKKLKNEI